MQNLSKSVMRVAKNSVKGYSDVQTKVRDATSNDPWGPSGSQMSEIAALTFNQNDFVEIMEMLDKRLNDKGKNWRHVFKSLTLLDYCLHAGSENTVMYFRENLYIIKTLKEFQYIDEYGKDQGANVRQKAKDITNLLLDENRMQSQRKSRASMTDRMNGGGGSGRPRSSTQNGDDDNRNRDTNRRARSVPPGGAGDADLAAAIEASKKSAAEESSRGSRPTGDSELEEAMRLSREDDERRKRELASQSGAGLFDEQQNNNLIDIDAAPYQNPAMTGFQSYNPYAQQQQQQQEEWMRQQQMMELQRQAQEQAQYQSMLQQQAFAQQQQQAQEDYMRQQAYQQQMAQQYQPQPLIPQPTAYGSNNPFAAFAPTPPVSATPPPPLPQSNSFNDNYQPQTPPPATTQQQQQPRPPRDDGKHSDLARLLAGGRDDGMDTFGNIGATRYPAQYAERSGVPMRPQETGRPNPFGTNFGQPQQQTQQTQQQQQQQQPPNNPFFDL